MNEYSCTSQWMLGWLLDKRGVGYESDWRRLLWTEGSRISTLSLNCGRASFLSGRSCKKCVRSRAGCRNIGRDGNVSEWNDGYVLGNGRQTPPRSSPMVPSADARLPLRDSPTALMGRVSRFLWQSRCMKFLNLLLLKLAASPMFYLKLNDTGAGPKE